MDQQTTPDATPEPPRVDREALYARIFAALSECDDDDLDVLHGLMLTGAWKQPDAQPSRKLPASN